MKRWVSFFLWCITVTQGVDASIQYAYTFEHQVTAIVSHMLNTDIAIDKNIMHALYTACQDCLSNVEFLVLHKSPEKSLETGLIEHTVRIHTLIALFLCRIHMTNLYVREDLFSVRALLEQIIVAYGTYTMQQGEKPYLRKNMQLLCCSKNIVDFLENTLFLETPCNM